MQLDLAQDSAHLTSMHTTLFKGQPIFTIKAVSGENTSDVGLPDGTHFTNWFLKSTPRDQWWELTIQHQDFKLKLSLNVY